MSVGGVALSLQRIEKRFGETVALDGASLSVQSGTLHALLGENGAGKTTLLDIAAGLTKPDTGTLEMDGQPVTWRTPADAMSAGIGAVHQHFSLVHAMTVAENVALTSPGVFRRFSTRETRARVRAIADAAGLQADPDALVGDLPVPAQQQVEIIKAIASDPTVLMLDEPTAVLSPPQAAELFAWLRDYVSRGHTAVVITHRIREAMRHADAVTVLRSGRTMLASEIRGTDERAVLSAMLGNTPIPSRDVATKSPVGNAENAGVPVLVLYAATVVDSRGSTRLAPTSLTVHAGEVLGVAGIDGAAQHDLLRVLAGRQAPSSGTAALPEGIGFVPEDRLQDAFIPEFSLVENLALRDAGRRRGMIGWSMLASITRMMIAEFGVKTPDEHAPASTLSGGNQQRFVLARELADSPAALVAENPTRGLDVRASRDVLDRLRVARDRGVAVVVYSNDIDELLAVSDRVVVCFGNTVREVSLDGAAIGRAMVGAP